MKDRVEGFADEVMLNQKHLASEVKKLGGSLVNESSGKWCVWQVEPPEGYEWVSAPECSAIRVEWLKGDLSFADASIRDAILRIREGIVEVDFYDED